MEYIIGPVIAVLLSGAGIYVADRKNKVAEEAIITRIERVENTIKVIDSEVPKRMVTLIAPVAAAVKEVRKEIGVE